MEAGDRWLLDHFIITRAKTIEMAKRIPDELWNRTAAGEELSTGRIMEHIVGAVEYYMSRVMCDGGPMYAPDSRNRAAIELGLVMSRDRLLRFYEADDGKRMSEELREHLGPNEVDVFPGRDRVSYLADHEVHHRAKMVLALRQWGFSDFPGMPYWAPRDYVLIEKAR